MSMFESIVRQEDVPPLELSSTYFFVAASVLDVGAPTFVSFFIHHIIISICGEIESNFRSALNSSRVLLSRGMFVKYSHFIIIIILFFPLRHSRRGVLGGCNPPISEVFAMRFIGLSTNRNE